MKRSALEALQQLSLNEGVILRPAAIDGSTEVYPLHRKATRAEAVEQAELLGALDLGVVPFNEGYAIRHVKGTRQEVKTVVESELTKICGVDLMVAEKSEGNGSVIRNVCKSINPFQMAHHMKHSVQWNIRVDKMDTKSRYSNTFFVFSKEAPRLWSPLMMDELTGQYQPVTIIEWVIKGSCKGLRCFNLVRRR